MAVKGVTVELFKSVLQVFFFVCMYVYAHAHFKMSHQLRPAAGCIQLAGEWCVCMCVRGTEKADVKDKQLPVLDGHSHISLLSLLFHPLFLFLLPSCHLLLHFYLPPGGVWFHHGQLGLRSSHNDWRIVHLQPQGGGPHLPGLPRWHWVRCQWQTSLLCFWILEYCECLCECPDSIGNGQIGTVGG